MSDYSLYKKVERDIKNSELVNESALNSLKGVQDFEIEQMEFLEPIDNTKLDTNDNKMDIDVNNKKSKVYLFTSNTGDIGVTTFSILFGQYLSQKNKKTLYLDLNEFRNKLEVLLGIKEKFVKFDSLFDLQGEILIQKLDKSLLNYNSLKILTIDKDKPFLPDTKILNLLISKFLEFYDNIIIDIKPSELSGELLSIADKIILCSNPSFISSLDNKVISDLKISKKMYLITILNKYKSNIRKLTKKEVEKIIGLEVLAEWKYPKNLVDSINVGLGIKYRDKDKKTNSIFTELEKIEV